MKIFAIIYYAIMIPVLINTVGLMMFLISIPFAVGYLFYVLMIHRGLDKILDLQEVY